MNTIRCSISVLFRIITGITIAFITWKLARLWEEGHAEETGHALDASFRVATQKLEKIATELEGWAGTGLGANPGKGIDEFLPDAKKTLKKTVDLV